MAVVILPLLRNTVRRPASWIAAGIAAVAAFALVGAPATPATIAVAVFCGGWAAIAAAGDLPRGVVPGHAAVDSAIGWTRALWPLAGVLAALAGRAAAGTAPEVAAAVALGAVVATACGAAANRGGVAAADAASLAACATLGAAAVALSGSTARPALAAVATFAAVTSGLACAGAAGARALARGAWPTADREPRPPRIRLAEIAIARGSIRRILVALAMASSLAGLAGWYFLVPETAAYGCPFAVAWFAALALPAALLGPPTSVGWRTLALAAPAPTGRPASGLRPAGAGWVAAVAIGHATLLGWPPLVAAIVHAADAAGPPGDAAGWAWMAVGALAVAAACLAGAGAVVAALDMRRETAFAVAIGLASAVGIGLAAGLPSLPSLPC